MPLIRKLVKTCNSTISTTIVKQVLLYSHFLYSRGDGSKKRAKARNPSLSQQYPEGQNGHASSKRAKSAQKRTKSAQPQFELEIPRRAKWSCQLKGHGMLAQSAQKARKSAQKARYLGNATGGSGYIQQRYEILVHHV